MPAYATRLVETRKQPSTPRGEYANLSNEQFLEFSRIYLKDGVIEQLESYGAATADIRKGINTFFENIPAYMLDFSTDTSRKLLCMYIVSNMRDAFLINHISDEFVYNLTDRLFNIDPRIQRS